MLFVFLLPNLVNYRSNMALWASKEGVKRDWCPENVFKIKFVMTLLASTPVFHKKKESNSIFVIFDVLFVDARHILDTFRSQGLSSDEKTTLFKNLILLLMSFKTLDVIFISKKNRKYYTLLPSSLFVYSLPSFTNKWPYTTLTVFEEGEIE